MVQFYKPQEGAVEWYPTKYDGCSVVATGNDYKFQKGSGRSEVVQRFCRDGMTIEEVTKAAARAGFTPIFVVGSILKHANSPGPAFNIEAPEGSTLEAIKSQRQPRRVSPEVAAKRAALEEERAAKRAAREEARAAKEAEKAERLAKRESAKADREAEKEAKRKAREEARASKRAESGETKPTKGKRKGKVAADPSEDDSDHEEAA